jgi:RHS repeat-associated protein
VGRFAAFARVTPSARYALASRDADGNVTLAESYEPYGTVLTSTGTASSIFGYAGEQIDTTGLIYLRARYMNPRLGIFLARDPWSGDQMRPGSMNGWNYAEANPINRVDPSGWQSNPPQCPPSHPILRVDRGPFNSPFVPPLYWCEDSKGHAVNLDGSQRLRIYSGTVFVGPNLSTLAKAILAALGIWCAGGIIAYESTRSTDVDWPRPPREREATPTPFPPPGPEPEEKPERLYAFGGGPNGNNPGPRVRPGNDIYVDIDGMVEAQNPPFPDGASTFSNLKFAPLSGPYYYISKDRPMPPGLAVIADGQDVNPASRNAETHHTIYPTVRMLFVEFERLFKSLGWTYGGSK